CERGAFDGDQARAVLTAGKERGLIPRVQKKPALVRPGCAARRRAGRGLRGPLHASHRRGCGRPGAGRHGRHAAARGGVLDPLDVSGRAPAAGRGRHGRAVAGLQPRLVLHQFDAVLHRPGRTGHGDDPGRGGLGGHRGRGAGAAPRRRGAHRPRRPGRSRAAGRALPRPSRLPPRRTAGLGGLARGHPGL
ncbi:LOW QUALITY PROTEIN: imidazolonepropionase, partial [Streptomyces himastatinicus ATCC 53653]